MFSKNVIILYLLLCLLQIISFTRSQVKIDSQCSQGKQFVSIEELFQEGQFHPGDSGAKLDFPCWFDLKLARRGQNFAHNNFGLIFSTHILSLCFLLADQQTRRVLVITKRSYTPEKAFKRYVATAQHVLLWYQQDILSQTWLNSIRTIRHIHQAVQKYSTNISAMAAAETILTPLHNPSGFTPNQTLWEAFEEDLKLYKYKIKIDFSSPKYLFNQYTMVATLWTFMALPVIHPKEMGISSFSEADLRGFVHLWAVIGYSLGIEEKFIFCKEPHPNTWRSCKKNLNEIYRSYIIPQFLNLDFEGKIMIESLMQAVHKIVPFYPLDAFMIAILEDILGVPALNLKKIRSPQSALLGSGGAWYIRLQRTNRAAQWFLNTVVLGELQLASIKTFGNPGTNASQVALSHFYVE